MYTRTTAEGNVLEVIFGSKVNHYHFLKIDFFKLMLALDEKPKRSPKCLQFVLRET